MTKVLMISMVTILAHLLAGCATTAEDFAEMSAAQRAKNVCDGPAYAGRYDSEIQTIRSSKGDIESKISAVEEALASGFWTEKSCKQVKVRTGSTKTCEIIKNRLVCTEIDDYKTVDDCETIRTRVDEDSETEKLAGYRSQLPSLNDELASVRKERQNAYIDCRDKVIEMSPEEAFQLYGG